MPLLLKGRAFCSYLLMFATWAPPCCSFNQLTWVRKQSSHWVCSPSKSMPILTAYCSVFLALWCWFVSFFTHLLHDPVLIFSTVNTGVLWNGFIIKSAYYCCLYSFYLYEQRLLSSWHIIYILNVYIFLNYWWTSDLNIVMYSVIFFLQNQI